MNAYIQRVTDAYDTSHVAQYMSHVTRHTSHVTRLPLTAQLKAKREQRRADGCPMLMSEDLLLRIFFPLLQVLLPPEIITVFLYA